MSDFYKKLSDAHNMIVQECIDKNGLNGNLNESDIPANLFMRKAGKEPLNIKQFSVQVGCFLEEVSELLKSLADMDINTSLDKNELCRSIDRFASLLKNGAGKVKSSTSLREEFVDSIGDTMFTLRAMAYFINCQTSTVEHSVSVHNLTKVLHLTDSVVGKIQKPDGFIPPNHKGLYSEDEMK